MTPNERQPFLGGAASNWGGKALIVCALAFLMAIPGLFVFALISDRAHRQDGVLAEVSALRGGRQSLLGPMVAAPWRKTAVDGQATTGWYLVSPREAYVRVDVRSSSLHRGLFQVPVYDATALVEADFDPLPLAVAGPDGAVIDWAHAVFVFGFSDLRGARSDVTAHWRSEGMGQSTAVGMSLPFAPDSAINVGGGPAGAGQQTSFGLVTSPAPWLKASARGGQLTMTTTLSGAQALAVMPFAKVNHVAMKGDWPSPSFGGAFLPTNHTITSKGFVAAWNIPFLARGLSDQGGVDALSVTALDARSMQVTFALAGNPYESVTRALKYGVMFIGLVFLTFFVFEALSGRRVHAAQYVLIGLAQMVFYLLLLSLSEYLGFDIAFVIAAVGTVGLISLYAGWAFKSAAYRLRAFIVFTLLYALIYALMRLEDFALLAGSLASFVGLAAAMYMTRNLDWYGARVERPGSAEISKPDLKRT
jgi:inner membrane protein